MKFINSTIIFIFLALAINFANAKNSKIEIGIGLNSLMYNKRMGHLYANYPNSYVFTNPDRPNISILYKKFLNDNIYINSGVIFNKNISSFFTNNIAAPHYLAHYSTSWFINTPLLIEYKLNKYLSISSGVMLGFSKFDNQYSSENFALPFSSFSTLKVYFYKNVFLELYYSKALGKGTSITVHYPNNLELKQIGKRSFIGFGVGYSISKKEGCTKNLQ